MPRTSDERRARMREYYQEHSEQIKAYQRRYYEEHGEKVRARVHKYSHEHLEESKPRRMTYQREYRLKNPNYNREHCRQFYVAYRNREIRRRVESIKKNRQKMNEFKATLQCSRCGESFPDCPPVIEFHHTGKDPKSSKITLLMGRGLSSKSLQAELAKCIPLCANCHQIVHDLERQKKSG